MKKLIISQTLFSIMLVLSICTQSLYAQNSYYIETTKFDTYAPKPGTSKTEYRYDAAKRMILSFSTTGETIIVTIFDYDAVGNMIEKSTLMFIKDPKIKYKYTCSANISDKKFKEIIQKILDRLDKK